jgi:hypothetical protein
LFGPLGPTRVSNFRISGVQPHFDLLPSRAVHVLGAA